MKTYMGLLNKSWKAVMISLILLDIAVVGYYFFAGIEAVTEGKNNIILSYALMLLMVVCVFLAGKGTRRKLQKLKGEELPKKLERYRALLIKRFLFYGLVNFIAIIGVVASGQISYMIFCVISLLLIVLSKPTELKLKVELALGEEDMRMFEKLRFEK